MRFYKNYNYNDFFFDGTRGETISLDIRRVMLASSKTTIDKTYIYVIRYKNYF